MGRASASTISGADTRCGSEQLSGLVTAELIDQIELLPEVRYAFRHPLVRTVCYESQLSATRCTQPWPARSCDRAAQFRCGKENSALIAHHLEAAGQLDAAHMWYMRAGGWLKHRDFVAARECWDQAQRIADGLPEGEGLDAKRIAPRAQLTSTAWLVSADSRQCFDELRELTTRSDDWLPLAEGMSGRLTSLIITDGRVFDGVAMAAELQALIDQIDSPPALRAEILMAIAFAQFVGCDFDSALRTTDRLRAIPEANPDDAIPATSVAGCHKGDDRSQSRRSPGPSDGPRRGT